MSVTTGTQSTYDTLFFEEQRYNQPWLRTLFWIAAAGAWLGFIYDVFSGPGLLHMPLNTLVPWLILLVVVGTLVPWLFLSVRLSTTVRPDRVEIRFRPFTSRDIRFDEIEKCYARHYRPICEYGGWGVRGCTGKNMAYNVHGSDGVQFELKNGKRVLIGSQRAEAFARAVNDAMSC